MSSVPNFPPILRHDDLALIARRATPLAARISSRCSEEGRGPDEEERMAARFELWNAETAGGKPELFGKRLEWDGLTAETAKGALTDEWAAPAQPPEWLRFLGGLRAANGSSPWAEAVAASIDRRQTPFAAAFAPFLTAAFDRLAPTPSAMSGRLDPAIFPGAGRSLLVQLARLSAPILSQAFDAHLREKRAVADAASSLHHDAFVEPFAIGQAWGALLGRFPVLARLMAIVCLGWVRETQEFLHRLEADWNLLEAERFLPAAAEAPCVLRNVRSDVSDRHGGAGVVRVLEFSTGHRLVYKRRPLDLEADFHGLLRTLAAHGLRSAPPALRVLPRAGYGWVEYAEATPVSTAAALDDWFRKAGALLCLMHLLGGNDGHMENVVATAAGPILIDLETLLQPGLAQPEPTAAGTFALAARQVRSSVLQTGLLPFWQRGRGGRLHDIGGFTGAGGYESPVLRLTWENIGSDGVRAAWKRGIARALANLPIFEDSRHSAVAHLATLCSGFAETWRFLRSHRDLLIPTLETWEAAPVRVLLRATTHYAALFERSCHHEAMAFGIDRSLIFEALRRPFVQNHVGKPAFWPAIDEEARALEEGDIPTFFVKAGGHDLETADGRCLVQNAFAQSALAAALPRFEDLSEAGLSGQLEMIAAAFIEPGGESSAPPSDSAEGTVDLDALLAATPLISDQGFIKAATVLASQILNAAIRGRDGFVTWLAPAFLQPNEGEQRGVSYYLYDGAAGIALFLAALARVTGLAPARTTALAALDPIRAILDSPNASLMIQREGIGGCSGLGSLVYAFTVIARLLEAPELLDRARRISRLIDSDRIARDQALDIVNGSAGAIVALLALHRATGDRDALERAVACGRHLLSRSVHVGDNALAWPSWPDRLLLGGYSHGAAGQSAALAALFSASGDEEFAEAALAGLRYERTLFDPEAGNWPILLPGGGSRFCSTWCHGAPGILLGRLGMLGRFGEAEDALMLEEMNAARQATLRTGVNNIDHLCCGTMGRVEILHLDARGDRRRLDFARLGATLSLRRAQARKAFSLQPDPVCNSVFQPGFFRGTSGIGYGLLRLARPDLVPSIFSWEI